MRSRKGSDGGIAKNGYGGTMNSCGRRNVNVSERKNVMNDLERRIRTGRKRGRGTGRRRGRESERDQESSHGRILEIDLQIGELLLQ